MRIIIFPAAATAIQFCQKLNNIQMKTERVSQLGDVITTWSYVPYKNLKHEYVA